MMRLKWTDPNGKKQTRHRVRSMGPKQGYGIWDVGRNLYVAHGFSTRKEAWEALRAYERELSGREAGNDLAGSTADGPSIDDRPSSAHELVSANKW